MPASKVEEASTAPSIAYAVGSLLTTPDDLSVLVDLLAPLGHVRFALLERAPRQLAAFLARPGTVGPRHDEPDEDVDEAVTEAAQPTDDERLGPPATVPVQTPSAPAEVSARPLARKAAVKSRKCTPL